MLVLRPTLLEFEFMQVKLVLVGALMLYHFFCEYILRKLKKNELAWSSLALRLWNELATVFLVSVVFIIELKHEMNWIWGTLSFIGVGVALMVVVQLVKKIWKN